MQKINLNLKEATAHDIPQIARLAVHIWNEHYTPIIGKDQVEYMLNLMYSTESLTEQMIQKQHRFYLVIHSEQAVGFVSLHEERNEEWFLNKFYILPRQSRQGLGTGVLNELKELIRPEKITLTVNRQNYKSINFYFKNGFNIHHVEDFDIGNGYVMNDFVMEWRLKK